LLPTGIFSKRRTWSYALTSIVPTDFDINYSSDQSKSIPPAEKLSSSTQSLPKHDADAQTEHVEPTPAQVAKTANRRNTWPSQRTFFRFKDYNNNDFELVVKISKQLEPALKTQYGAQGDGLGKISTTNSNTNCILSAKSEINQFEFLNKLKRQGKIMRFSSVYTSTFQHIHCFLNNLRSDSPLALDSLSWFLSS